MAAADALIAAAMRAVGKTPEDLGVYMQAFENRLREVRALTRGGTVDGVQVPGMLALYAEVQALSAKLDRLLANPPTSRAESTAESRGGNPHPQQE